MAFAKKTWKDRIAEFPTRRRLTKEDNTSELVTVAREEGTLSQEGDAFSADNMNDLESRIDAEFTEVNGKLMDNVITLADNIYLHKYGNLRILNIADTSANNIHQLKLPEDSIPKEDIRAIIMFYDNSQKSYFGLVRYLISKGYIECYGLINYASTITILTNATTKISGQLIWIV